MSRFGTHYQVSRPTGVCAATGRPLAPDAACIATLCDRPEDEGFDRLDFSVEAWEQGARPERLFSFWRTVVSSEQRPRRLLVDDDVLTDLFVRLEGDERPQRVAFRFVLALILMRKRILRFVGRSGEGTDEQWLMRLRGGDADAPPIAVANPHLSDEDVRELTAQLGEILQGEV